MRKLLATFAGLATLAMAGAASADVYTLNIDHCSGGCTVPAGTVTVTQNGLNTIHFAVQLTGTDYFNEAGNSFDTVNFSLANVNGVSITNISNPLFVADSGSLNGDGFGSGFNFAVNYDGTNGNFNGGQIQALAFDVTQTGLTPLSLQSVGGTKVAVDIASVQGNVTRTGLVGGTLGRTPGVPEPATWAMMIIGVAGMGTVLRRRRAPAFA